MALFAAEAGELLVAIFSSTSLSELRWEAAVSHCGNDAKYCARSSVSNEIPGGTLHSPPVSSCATSASEHAIRSMRERVRPRSPMSPGAVSHSSSRSRRIAITSSGCSIFHLFEEDVGYPADGAEVVHSDSRVGDDRSNRALGVGDELEHANRIHQSGR